jgi:hypothetical protein
MKNPFLDTKEFPTLEEMDLMQEIEDRGGYVKDSPETPFGDCIASLMGKGLLYPFSKWDKRYACLISSSSCRPVTFHFHPSHIKIGVNPETQEKQILTEGERERLAFMRKFIAHWIFKEEKIPKETFFRFLKYFTNRLPYLLSVPSFIVSELCKEVEETEIKLIRLTPEFKTAICQMCGTSSYTSTGEEFISCSQCNALILVR